MLIFNLCRSKNDGVITNLKLSIYLRIDAGETRKEIQRMYALLGKKNEDIFLWLIPLEDLKSAVVNRTCKPIIEKSEITPIYFL